MGLIVRRAFLVLAVLCAYAGPSAAALIEHRIDFTRTSADHVSLGARDFRGTFFVDDSIIGPGFENMTYGPFSPEMALLTDFTVTMDGSASVYNFNLVETRRLGTPVPYVIALGPDGQIIDVRGRITMASTSIEIVLGPAAFPDEYHDFTGPLVSRGTYAIVRVTPLEVPLVTVPEPGGLAIFVVGLMGLGLLRRDIGP